MSKAQSDQTIGIVDVPELTSIIVGAIQIGQKAGDQVTPQMIERYIHSVLAAVSRKEH